VLIDFSVCVSRQTRQTRQHVSADLKAVELEQPSDDELDIQEFESTEAATVKQSARIKKAKDKQRHRRCDAQEAATANQLARAKKARALCEAKEASGAPPQKKMRSNCIDPRTVALEEWFKEHESAPYPR
jgi:hypothetical protein